MKILLVEDDVNLLDITAYALRREGFNVIAATDGAQALRRWETDQPNLVVLDVGLPRVSGLEVCRKIRETASTPVILLTGFADEETVLKGFRVGADDYVTKPFSPSQLAMRIRAVWRRGSRAGDLEPVGQLHAGDLILDVESHEVFRAGRKVHLTPIEFRVLYLLTNNAGRVISASRLVEYAWGYDASDVSLLKTHICHIRKKLQLKRGASGDICAVPGVGYRLVGVSAETPEGVAAPEVRESASAADQVAAAVGAAGQVHYRPAPRRGAGRTSIVPRCESTRSRLGVRTATRSYQRTSRGSRPRISGAWAAW